MCKKYFYTAYTFLLLFLLLFTFIVIVIICFHYFILFFPAAATVTTHKHILASKKLAESTTSQLYVNIVECTLMWHRSLPTQVYDMHTQALI